MTIKTIFITAGCAFVLLGRSAGTAAADHGSPVYLLKSHYQQQRKALDDAFRAEREQIECIKRDALAAWRIDRTHAVQLCARERPLALRQLAGRRREIMIRFRAEMAGARGNYELQVERLNRWYDIQRRQLVYRPVFGGPKICQDATCPPPAFGAPSSPHVLPNPQTPSYGYKSEYHEERSTPGTEVIVPESQPLFNVEETRTYLPRQSPRSGFAIQLGRLGVLRFGI